MTKKTTKKLPVSAIDAFLGLQWAIEPNWLNNAWNVLQRSNGEFAAEEDEKSALRTIEGSRPEGTAYTVIPENSRTAIIEIWGAIFPRANYITYYSGGTSAELLVRDIKAAQANSNIDNILFLIHSPGGDVVGVTEVVDAIRDFRAAGKTATAYVKGYCASAAFWIASTCDRIVANRTAQLGSIGVYAVYLDDSKALEMRGLKETVFKSKQSPDKNADHTTERGAQLIQVRMDDLCEEFINDIAQNMNVSVQKIEKSFGAGDMMTARRAKKAGLCHEIATFDEAVAIAAKPASSGEENFSGSEEEAGDKSGSQTLNSSDAVNSEKSAEALADSALDVNQKPENSNLNEESMPEKKDENAAATAENQKAPETDKTPEAANAAGNEPKKEDSAKPEETAVAAVEIVANGTNVAEMAKQLAEANQRIAAMETAALKTDLEKVAAGFAGDQSKHVGIMTALVGAHGRESAQVKDYIELQTAAANQLKEAKIYDEQGKTGAESLTGNTALEQLNAKAAEIAREKSVSKQKAFVLACEQNPELYEAHQNGK